MIYIVQERSKHSHTVDPQAYSNQYLILKLNLNHKPAVFVCHICIYPLGQITSTPQRTLLK